MRDPEAALDSGYGICGGGSARVKWATLVFNEDAAQCVANQEWHPQQKTRWLKDGRCELQVPYSEPTELVMDILRHGDSVVVTSDKALAGLIQQRLRRALAAYVVAERGDLPLLTHPVHGALCDGLLLSVQARPRSNGRLRFTLALCPRTDRRIDHGPVQPQMREP